MTISIIIKHSTDISEAKKLFFDNLPAGSFALINADDRNGKVMVQNTLATVNYYGIRSMADFKARIIESHINGMLLNIDNTEVWTHFIGEFNAYNLLAVYATATAAGSGARRCPENFKHIGILLKDGFSICSRNDGVTAVIDYAHTPDALINVLKTISQIRGKSAS